MIKLGHNEVTLYSHVLELACMVYMVDKNKLINMVDKT